MSSVDVVPTIVVLAKAPVPGRVKTRCTPPCSPVQAAALAAAALADTLGAVARVPGVRRLLVLDGAIGSWLPPSFDVVAQRGAGLGARLDHAFSVAGAPALLVGMDTPQLRPDVLVEGIELLRAGGDVLGRAADGGFWAVGLGRRFPGLFAPVPMSRHDTGRQLHRRMAEHGREPSPLPWLTDVDDIGTAVEVADLLPDSLFARAVRTILEDPAVSMAVAR